MHEPRRRTRSRYGSSTPGVTWWLLLAAASLAACSAEATTTTGFEQLTLATYEGFGPPAAGDADCDSSAYPMTTHVVSSSRELSWDYCGTSGASDHVEPQRGSRVLSEAELRSVEDALGNVQVTHGSSCGADASVVTLDLDTDTGEAHYANDFYAGCPGSLQDGREFASGIEALDQVVNTLAGIP